MLCGWLGKTGGAFRFSLTFSPFFVKKKGMASAAKERKKIRKRKSTKAKRVNLQPAKWIIVER
jgi:hypothetical protein